MAKVYLDGIAAAQAKDAQAMEEIFKNIGV
jgi:hypothetical protein